MKYTTLAIFTYNDDKPDKQSLYRYDTLDEAVQRFHSVFGYMGAEDVETIMAVVLNAQGGLIRSEFWEKITEET